MNSIREVGRCLTVYACVLPCTQAQYGPSGDGGGGSSGCSAPSHLGRPCPSRPRNSLFGAADFLVVPHESKAWGPGGAGSSASRFPNTIGETEVALRGRLEETGSDGTVGKSGAEPQGGGVCVFGVGCDALLENRGKTEEGGSHLASLTPRECPSSRVCRDLGGFNGRGARARNHFLCRV